MLRPLGQQPRFRPSGTERLRPGMDRLPALPSPGARTLRLALGLLTAMPRALPPGLQGPRQPAMMRMPWYQRTADCRKQVQICLPAIQ